MRIRFVCLLFAAASLIFSQTTASTLTGVVKDETGAVVAGAKLSVVNENTGVVMAAATNEAGLYRVVGLNPGTYRIEIDATGFQKLVRSGIAVQISETVQVDAHLKVGTVQETVNVTESAPILESQSSTVGQLVERQMIAGMPMPNRTSTALIALIPGATIQNVTGDIPIFSVGGGRMRNQQFTLDGGNHTNTVGLAVNQSQVPLPMDAMQEFRVLANNYSAEYGQSQSGVVTLATRAGTNKFHGTLFEYARNEALDSRDFFAARRAKFRQHQFGGSFGGPIRKDRTHFFVTYERTQQVTGAPTFRNLPTQAQRQGDFSSTLNAQGRMVTIYDPATTEGNRRQPFPGNAIPAARIDSVAKNMIGYWPLPNTAGTITGANNFYQNTRPSLDRDIVVGRVDHQINGSNQVMARYFVAYSRNKNPGVFGDTTADSGAGTTNQWSNNIFGTWAHTFRPNLLNEFRLGMVRRDYFNQRYAINGDYASKLGLKGVSGAGFPIINITGYSGLSGAPFRFSRPLLDYQVQDAVSWFRGKHALKIGMEVRFGIFNDDTDTSSSGNFTFGQQLSGLPGDGTSGNGFATFLMGEVDSANIIRPDPIKSRSNYLGVYLQDDWRISEALTFNLGLRWEGTTPRTEDENRINAFDMLAVNPVSNTPGVVTFIGRNGLPRTAWDFDGNNFGPRVGFAWRALPKTVIRGGSGIIYGPAVNSIIGTSATLGFSTDFRISASQVGFDSAMRLRDGFPAFKRPTIEELGAGFGAVAVGRTPNTAVTFFERNRPTPISLQYNFSIQHELATNLLFEISYLSNLSHHLTATPDLSINQVRPELLSAGNAQVRRPFPQFNNVMLINPPLGNSSYHGGYVKMERRFRSGLSMLAHYTFSKYIDDVLSFTESGDPGGFMDFYNRRLDRGLSGSDIRHRSVLSAVYDLPALRDSGWLGKVFGGWRTGVIASFQSGAAYTVFSAVNQTNAFPAGSLRADIVGNPNLAESERSLGRWFNTSAFRIPDPYKFGTVGRGIMSGPGMWNIDSSFIKSFPVRESWRAELRAEFFNLLNHANFGLPGHSVGGPAYGVISSSASGRNAQFAVRIEF